MFRSAANGRITDRHNSAPESSAGSSAKPGVHTSTILKSSRFQFINHVPQVLSHTRQLRHGLG